MTTRIRTVLGAFRWWHWLLAVIFVIALAAAGLFAVRAVRYSLYWRQHRDQPIAGWMTVNYVAHSYDVPADALWGALGLPPPPKPPARPDRRPLSAIATAQGKSFDQVRAALQQAIARERAAHPPGSPPPPSQPPGSPPAPPPARGDRGTP